MTDIVVSIVCITYNQEKYIAEAIDGFLMQKTNFNYEILIQDDASTDQTADIIRKYEMRYPDIIRPVYQTQNQYSKGIHVLDFYQAYARGRYIAICEGDDYWTDPNKLQKQVDYMMKHPDCSACVHGAIKVDAITGKTVGIVRPSPRSRDFTVEEVILGGGGLFATNSILYDRAFSKHPEFYYNCPIGDYPLMIHLAISGRVHYMQEVMSAYRIGAVSSWTYQISRASIDKRMDHIDKIEMMLKEVDEYTNKEYTDTIDKKIKKNRFELLVSLGDYEGIKSDTYKAHYRSLSLYKRLHIFIKQYFPHTTMFLKTRIRKNG
ncbi:MAG: glycosyltransferase [Vallitaleaceae bacterium]|nr:glycosyltransferase [Vallitaleaceae bacterium]